MEDKIIVRSKYNGYLVVVEPNTNIRRVFPELGFKMALTREALKNISYSEGGRYILENYLTIEDEDLIDELELNLDVEDKFSEEDIKELLLDGSLAQLGDAIDYGNEGTKSLIKDVAIKINLSDNNKIKLISKKMNIDFESILDLANDAPQTIKKENRREKIERQVFVPSSKKKNKEVDNDNYQLVNGERVKVRVLDK